MPATLDQPRHSTHRSSSTERTRRPRRSERRARENDARQPRRHAIKPTWDRSNRPDAAAVATGAPATSTRPTSRRRKSRLGRFFSGFTREKSFTILSFLVASGLIVLCSLDLAFAWPWMHASLLFDWTYLGVGLAMLWLTWDVFNDQSR
ncbi:hypothetical protein [Stieleria sp.]|uniref:hypothetical protein n=1 Tax=Stieleria sp. TaxID=2795976 RepID=UPI003567EC6D